jgi:hypothetical protein
MERQPIPWKQLVIDALDLLSSANEQIEYVRNVPRFDVTPEIVAAWSSDAYHPEVAQFREMFSAEELEALRQFDEVFRHNIDQLPESQNTVDRWLSSSAWKAIMQAASEARGRIAV